MLLKLLELEFQWPISSKKLKQDMAHIIWVSFWSFYFQINPKIANMNFRPVKLESPFFKQLKNYKQLQEDFGKLQDDTGINEMESFLKIEVWFLSIYDF